MQFLVLLSLTLSLIISILPFRLLAESVYFSLLYYRLSKKVVRANLALALPHLSDKERVEKKSYRHLCDMFMEMIKTMSISSKEMNKRFVITNIELIKEYEQKEKSIMLLASHYASWEWLITLNQKIGYHGVGVYKKLSKYFDKLIRDIRSKYNNWLTPAKRFPISPEIKNKGFFPFMVYPAINPKGKSDFHWNSFMVSKFHTGPEMLAKDMT
jgi:KDO2-lipid IV(A) lauroyltransferase